MSYSDFPNESKIWIYQTDRELMSSEVKQIKEDGAQFVSQWAAHGSQLKAAFDVLHKRFIVLVADETQAAASGCSIDASMKFIKHLEKCFDLNLFDRMQVAYEQDGEVKTADLSSFEQMIQASEITADTIVFNNTIQTFKEFHDKWRVPVQESWHARMLA